MKTNVVRVLAAALFLALAAGAQAQTSDALVVNVPFDFVVRNITLPAGTYTIDRVLYNDPNTFQLRSKDGRASALTSGVVTGKPAHGEPTLVFNRYGEKYFLDQIRTNGAVHQLAKSRSEMQLAKMQEAERTSASGSN